MVAYKTNFLSGKYSEEIRGNASAFQFFFLPISFCCVHLPSRFCQVYLGTITASYSNVEFLHIWDPSKVRKKILPFVTPSSFVCFPRKLFTFFSLTSQQFLPFFLNLVLIPFIAFFNPTFLLFKSCATFCLFLTIGDKHCWFVDLTLEIFSRQSPQLPSSQECG